jgi:hypothetical protein
VDGVRCRYYDHGNDGDVNEREETLNNVTGVWEICVCFEGVGRGEIESGDRIVCWCACCIRC